VKPIGLGARDSLRLEAGLCLYGHDIDTTTTPIEAVLRGASARSAACRVDFPARQSSRKQIAEGAPRRRVGILPRARRSRATARRSSSRKSFRQGHVGWLRPHDGTRIAMGYVEKAQSANGTKVELMVRRQTRAG